MVHRVINLTPTCGRFSILGEEGSYPRAADIMSCVDDPNWHAEDFKDLYNKDFIWGVAMVCSKGMGLSDYSKSDVLGRRKDTVFWYLASIV